MNSKLIEGLSGAALAVVAAGLVACGGHDLEKELCEHMQEGPSRPVTAAGEANDAPPATFSHARADITLVEVPGGNGGFVRYEANKATDFVFALDKNVPLAFTGPGGEAVAVEKTEIGSAECSEVGVRHRIELAVGSYTLSFGPTTETEVRMVVEADDH